MGGWVHKRGRGQGGRGHREVGEFRKTLNNFQYSWRHRLVTKGAGELCLARGERPMLYKLWVAYVNH